MFLLSLITPRLMIYGAFALAIIVAATSLYVKGRNDGWDKYQRQIDKQNERIINEIPEIKRRAAQPDSLKRLRERWGRDK